MTMKTLIITRDSMMGHVMPTVLASYTDVDQLSVTYLEDYADWYTIAQQALVDSNLYNIVVLDIPFKVDYANNLANLQEKMDMPFMGMFWLASYGATLPDWVHSLPEGTEAFPTRVEQAVVQSNLMHLQWAEGGYLSALTDYYEGKGVGIADSPAMNLYLLTRLFGRAFMKYTRFTNLETVVAQYAELVKVQEQQLMYYVIGKSKSAQEVDKQAVVVIADKNQNEIAGHLLQTYPNVLIMAFYNRRVGITIRSKTESALVLAEAIQNKPAQGLPNATTIFVDNPMDLPSLLVKALQEENSWHTI